MLGICFIDFIRRNIFELTENYHYYLSKLVLSHHREILMEVSSKEKYPVFNDTVLDLLESLASFPCVVDGGRSRWLQGG